MRIERLAAVQVREAEGLCMIQGAILDDADRAARFAWLHECGDDAGDRLVLRRFGREARRGRQRQRENSEDTAHQ